MSSKSLALAVFGVTWALAGFASAAPVYCQTVSGTEIFRGKSEDLFTARQQATDHCEQAASTSDSQCEMNVTCTDPEAPQSSGPVTCQAASSGLVFLARDMNEAFAGQIVKSACESNPATSNAECDHSILCDQGSNSLSGLCQIKKGHLDLQRTGRTVEMARQAVVMACQSTRTLSRAECLEKVQCSVQALSDDGTTQSPPLVASPAVNPQEADPRGCFVQSLGQIVKWPVFFSYAELEAKKKGRCVYAKVSDHPDSGRIYLSDGTKLAIELSSSRARDAMRLAGLSDCEALTCETADSE